MLFKRSASGGIAKLVAGILLVSVVSTGLSATFLINEASDAKPVSTKVSDYLGQEVKWNSCGTDLYCGSVYVPMDWTNLKSEVISLSVVMHRASVAKPLGSIIFNPGGPGASGYDFVKDGITDLATEKLKKSYNIVGFDPRGVQNSSPIRCVSNPKELDDFVYGDTGEPLGSAKDIRLTKKLISAFAAKCAKLTGKLLGYVDTVNAAKDLDVLRAAVGDKKLNYLGYSYGTYLGNTYAALYPNKVGRMVLDGAIDPLVPQSVQNLNQLKGFDLSLQSYLKDCLANSGCPFTGNVASAQSKIKDFLKGLETRPIKTSDSNREVTVWMALNGINMALYSNEYWQYLNTAFEQAFKGDGTTLQRLADFYNDRKDDGTYGSNQTEANHAINCLDARESSKWSDIVAQNKRVLKASYVFGRYWQFGGIACTGWKYPAVKPLKSYSAKGSPTIVVVGTTGDPATPYAQAVSLAHKVLANGYLVTYRGEGHTAYGRTSSCVNSAIDTFFLIGKLAAQEPICN